ncbi:MAG: hypothetical protein HZB15_13210 [Actinobacteria bacterium]|nr:hypothetical protein [Actinomycetota bacterium]
MPRRQPDAPRPIPRTRAAVVAICVAAVSVTGCSLGERPTLDTSPTAAGSMTGDPAIDAVLSMFDDVRGAVFTATYTATLAYGSKTSDVVVTQDGSDATSVRRSVTIGDVRFITKPGARSTCTVSSAQCTDGIDPARVSDTGVTPEFTFGDMAKRLRRDATARVGTTTASTREVPGGTATCVDIPVTGGTKEYCSFADGALARFVGADVTIDVTDYRAAVDESLFTV